MPPFLIALYGNLLNGAILGAVYGMMTMGLSLIFGVLRIVNVGHGAFIMVGAYTAFFLFTLYGIPPLLAVPFSFIIGMGLGALFFYTVIKRLIDSPELTTLLATFSFGVLLEEVAKLLWGPDYRGFNWEVGSLHLPFVTIPLEKLYAFLASVSMALILYIWFKKGRSGMAIRAIMEDREGASCCGINVDGMYGLSFSIGIALTVASGSLLTLFIPVGIHPYMGGIYTLKAFVIAVLGGLSSPWGAFFGGFIFGLVENGAYSLFGLVPGLEPFSMTYFAAFLILLILLLIRPEGLLGANGG